MPDEQAWVPEFEDIIMVKRTESSRASIREEKGSHSLARKRRGITGTAGFVCPCKGYVGMHLSIPL